MERGADLHMAQLMPLPLTVYCFGNIQIGFTFLVPAHPGSPGQRAVKRVCGMLNRALSIRPPSVCVCVCLQLNLTSQSRSVPSRRHSDSQSCLPQPYQGPTVPPRCSWTPCSGVRAAPCTPLHPMSPTASLRCRHSAEFAPAATAVMWAQSVGQPT